MKKTLRINQTAIELDLEPDTPLLWILRDEVGLTGTKFGCGIAQCGACTVHLDGNPVRSCSLPFEAVPENSEITTIEDDWKDGHEWIKLGQQEGKLASFPTNLLLSIIHGQLEAVIQHNIQHKLSEKEVAEAATISSEILWRYLSHHSKSPQ